MKKYRDWVILGNLIALLVWFNHSILEKEAILSDGKLVLLELAPVDPRSLIQGDYMDLSYAISQIEDIESIPNHGFCILKSNEKGIAEKIRIQTNLNPIDENEFAIKYHSNGWRINIGAESYFFQEGKSEKFENAKYGGLRIDDNGNSILVGLYDENQHKIE